MHVRHASISIFSTWLYKRQALYDVEEGMGWDKLYPIPPSLKSKLDMKLLFYIACNASSKDIPFGALHVSPIPIQSLYPDI